MDKDNIEVKEIDYEKMVDDAFQHLIDTYRFTSSKEG